MRSIVSSIVFWGVASFFMVSFNTACLAGQPLALEPPSSSMFEDNVAFGGEDLGEETLSKRDDSVSVGQDRVVGPNDVVNDAVVLGADLTVLGTVTGDAVCIGGNLTVGPEAVIKGDLVNVGGTLTVDPSAKTYKDRVNIGGFPFGFLKGLGKLEGLESIKTPGPPGRAGDEINITVGPIGFAARLIRFVMDFVYTLLLLFFALLMTMFIPRQFERIEGHLTGEFPRSLLVGIASMAGTPIALLAFVISVIGILFIPFFLLALVISCLMGYVVFSRMLGRRLFPGRHIMLQILCGLLLLQGVILIGDVLLLPGGTFSAIIGHVFRGLGLVVFFCVNFIGLGAVLYSLWGKREPGASRAKAPETLENAAPGEDAGRAGTDETGEGSQGSGNEDVKEDAKSAEDPGDSEAGDDAPKE